ncbi:hypothetical protein [Pseudomonas caspiana]|uniref:hypothetical protein n=1 Tax=Pseudomonas caspiana TaxID=1451454 RepID=UPI0032EFF716
MEVYFELVISPLLMKKTKSIAFASGWCRGKVKGAEVYFKLSSNESFSEADVAFSERLRSAGKPVLVLEALVEDDVFCRYQLADFFSVSLKEKKIGIEMCKKSTDYFSKPHIYSNDVSDINAFYERMDLHVLREILHRRNLLNSTAAYGCTDIDGVFLNKDGRLIVCEFKRKYPAGSYHELLPNVLTLKDLACVVAAIQSGTYSTSGKRVSVECYGLDISHVNNYISIKALGVEYFYMIFDSRVASPASNLDYDFISKSVKEVVFSALEPSDFCGLSKTGGYHQETLTESRSKSGTFYSGVRYQLMMEKSLFSRGFKIP